MRFIIRTYCFKLLLVGVILSAVACTPRHATSHRFTRIDSLAFNQPDSALRLLQVVFGRKSLNKADRMHLELMRGVAMNRAWVDFTTDSVMLEVADYYRRHGSRNERLLSLYVLGCAYRDLHYAPRAIETWLQATAAADTTAADCDWATLMRVHSQMSEVYGRLGITEYQLQELQIAERQSWRIKDTLSALRKGNGLAGIYYKQGQYEKCISYSNELRERCSQYGYQAEADLNSCFIAKSYIALGEYEKAKAYLESYERCEYFYSDPKQIKGGRCALYILKGQYYIGIGRPDSALMYYRCGLPVLGNNDWHNAPNLYRGLCQAYKMLHQVDSSLKYSNYLAESLEREYRGDIAQAAINASSLYDYSIEQSLSRLKNQKIYQLKTWLLIISFVAAFIVVLLFLLHERRKRLLTEIRLLLSKAQSDLRMLKQALASGEKKNLPTIATLKERILQQEIIIRGYQKQLSGSATGQEFFQEQEIIQLINRYAYSPSAKMEDSDWKKLEETIEKFYPAFYYWLASLPLSPVQKYLCLLVKAGISSSSALDNLLGGRNSYSTNLRKRLSRKIFKEDLSAVVFNQRLMEIE